MDLAPWGAGEDVAMILDPRQLVDPVVTDPLLAELVRWALGAGRGSGYGLGGAGAAEEGQAEQGG